jgi:chemotaxis protein methyltransferase CheR
VALAPDILAGVARRLADHAGLQLPAWVVEARTTARIAALGVTPEAYLDLIESGRGQAELGTLVEAVRVGESSLFRHKPQIAALLDLVVPVLRARGRRTVRVWSAGCASGEEPYTLAIVLAHALPDHAIEIHATDMSAEAIEVAERGEYPRDELEDVPFEWHDAFDIDGDVIRVRPELRRLVTFERANLLDVAAPRGCDMVWCRNVLIYFSPEGRRRALDRLLGATLPGGFVFVGYSESLRDIDELEAQRSGDAVVYVRRDGPSDRKTPVPELRRTPPIGHAIVIPPSAPVTARTEDVLVLAGTPQAPVLTTQIGERLAIGGLRRLVIDLDPADLLHDDLAPVLRRACAAARAAGIEIALQTTRPGARRWLSRHGLAEDPR